MLIYIILIIYIIAGQIFLDYGKISKKFYCWSICMFLIIITGFRDEDIGMWDTKSVYLPSFKVIASNLISNITSMEDTQYKFIGFVLYSKFISLISMNSNFYIFMMAWPFYICVTYIIQKWTTKPGISFISLLGLGFLTYSFSMIRGMLALAFLALALDAFLMNKWKKFFIYVLVAASFHITSLAFLFLYPLKKVKWSVGKIIIIFTLIVALQEIMPFLWKNFVATFIKKILPAYNYYGNKGGVLASGMFIIYIMMLFVFLIKRWLVYSGFKIKISLSKIKKKKKAATLEDSYRNILTGMAVTGSIIIFMTSFLSEMIRIAMLFGLGSVLLAGCTVTRNKTYNSKIIIQIIEYGQMFLLIIYFIFAALPNMNALPYRFFF